MTDTRKQCKWEKLVTVAAVAAAMTRSSKGLLCGTILAGLPGGQLIAIGKSDADETKQQFRQPPPT
jgi:hypothetical protein